MSEKGGVMPADTGSNPVLRGGNTYPQAKGLWALGSSKEKPDDVGPVNEGRPGSKPAWGGAHVCQHLSFTQVWEGDQGLWPRSKPDPGNPAVRDCRGAYGNVGYG